MASPAAPRDGTFGGARANAAPPGPLLPVIRARRDFLACARARKWAMPGLIVQARDRGDGAAARVGFTCSKKVGKAVARNRAKRRLRAAARAVLPRDARPGMDYVLIGRSGATVDRPFADLLADLETAVARLNAGDGRGPEPGRRSGRGRGRGRDRPAGAAP